jgi:hypothetical protein
MENKKKYLVPDIEVIPLDSSNTIITSNETNYEEEP